jgi:hypothetical protein
VIVLAAAAHASQTWPTIGRVFSAAAAVAAAGAGLLGARNRSKLNEIKVIVNGNLGRSLRAVETAAAELVKTAAERDSARADLAALGNRASDHRAPVTAQIATATWTGAAPNDHTTPPVDRPAKITTPLETLAAEQAAAAAKGTQA